MDFFIVGSLVGLSLGITGSGGSMLAIPLFMTLSSLSLKDSTFYSLIVVALASLLGVVTNLKSVSFKYAIYLSVGSILGSFCSHDLKMMMPDDLITFIYFPICTYSLIAIWKKDQARSTDQLKETKIFTLVLMGIPLGILTTLTGLGGGVLLLPLFLNIFHLEESKAVGTSLLTIFISSSLSFLIQWKYLDKSLNFFEISWLTPGVILATFSVKILVKKLRADRISFLRRIIYTLIVVFTLTRLLS